MLPSRAVARVVLVTVGLLVALYLLYQLRQIIGMLVIAAFLAVALAPAVALYERLRVPRVVAILLVYLTIFLAVFGVGLLVVPPIVEEVDTFVANVPAYVEDIRDSEALREYDDRYAITEELKQQAEKLPARLGDAAGALQSVTVGVFTALFQLVTILVITLFLLLDGRRIADFLFAQLGPEHEQRARVIAADVSRAVGGYVAGAFTISLIAGLSTFVVVTLLGLPFAVPLSVLMAFLVLIPLVGSAIGGALVAIVAALHDFPGALIAWLAFFLVYQQLENHVLQPQIYRRTVALHPLLVIVAVLVGSSQLGVLGALLAIPAAATIQIVVKEWWRHRRAPPVAAEPALAGEPPPPADEPPPAGPPPEPAPA